MGAYSVVMTCTLVSLCWF